MFEQSIIKEINLREGERVKAVIRPSYFAWFWPIFFAGFLILLAFFLIYPLFQRGIWGAAIFAGLLFFGLFLAWRIFVSHFFTALVLTSSRLVDFEQKGFFGRTVSSALFSKVEDAVYEKRGILGAIFNLGDVVVSLSGSQTKIKLAKVRNARSAAEEIIFRQKKFLAGPQTDLEKEAKRLLVKIKNKVGDEEFRRLISD